MKRQSPSESDIYHGTVDGKAYQDFHRERIRAHAKFGPLNDSREDADWNEPTWLPILVEEVGEVARVLCETKLGNYRPEEAQRRLREELVQVGAMTAAWIDSLCALKNLGEGE